MKTQRGFGLVAYALIALALVGTLLALYSLVDGRGYARGSLEKQAEWDGANQKRRALLDKEREDRVKETSKKEQDHAKNLKTIEDRYRAARAELRQLRDKSSGNDTRQPLSAAASGVACPDRQADVARGLENLEAGVLELLERGDKAIERTGLCKAWLEGQQAIKAEYAQALSSQ